MLMRFPARSRFPVAKRFPLVQASRPLPLEHHYQCWRSEFAAEQEFCQSSVEQSELVLSHRFVKPCCVILSRHIEKQAYTYMHTM